MALGHRRGAAAGEPGGPWSPAPASITQRTSPGAGPGRASAASLRARSGSKQLVRKYAQGQVCPPNREAMGAGAGGAPEGERETTRGVREGLQAGAQLMQRPCARNKGEEQQGRPVTCLSHKGGGGTTEVGATWEVLGTAARQPSPARPPAQHAPYLHGRGWPTAAPWAGCSGWGSGRRGQRAGAPGSRGTRPRAPSRRPRSRPGRPRLWREGGCQAATGPRCLARRPWTPDSPSLPAARSGHGLIAPPLPARPPLGLSTGLGQLEQTLPRGHCPAPPQGGAHVTAEVAGGPPKAME